MSISEHRLWNLGLLHELPFLSSSKHDWKLPDHPFTVCSHSLSTRDSSAHPVPRCPRHHLRTHLHALWLRRWRSRSPEAGCRAARLPSSLGQWDPHVNVLAGVRRKKELLLVLTHKRNPKEMAQCCYREDRGNKEASFLKTAFSVEWRTKKWK